MNKELTITLCMIVTTGFTIYLLIEFSKTFKQVKQLSEHQSNDYKIAELKKLLIKAIEVTKKHVNTIAHPYFFNNKIEHILTVCPQFVHVLRLAKYTLDYPEAKEDMHFILIELYGENFEDSLQLNILARVQTSEYGVQEYFHYIIGDFEKATYLYVHNRKYLQKIL